MSLLVVALTLFLLSASIGAAWNTKPILAILLFFLGFFLYGPDSLISGTAPIDFGARKGVSTAAGMVNGFGSIGGALGGALPGLVKDQWGWPAVWLVLAASIVTAALLLAPRWNVLPGDARPRPAP